MSKTPRTLRSKKHRAALYYAYKGRCAQCGARLPPNWHADHKTPYKIKAETNVHKMQPLCPQCNLRKGARMLRQHQQDFAETCNYMRSTPQNKIKHVLCHVTPGGGKSVLPVIATAVFIPHLADKICWVVPRVSLQKQAEKAFQDEVGTRILGRPVEIRTSTNEPDPSRDKIGFVTTYQAIGYDPASLSQEFSRYRYILILDEPHHIEQDSTWHKAMQEIVDKAAIVIYMSGTLERASGKRIAFLPYIRAEEGYTVDTCINMESETEWAVIQYSLRQALDEPAGQAVIPLYFYHVDGDSQWIDTTGQQCFANIAGAGLNSSEALYTALQTKYAHQLLDDALRGWSKYKKDNSRSKLLVVAANINAAKEYVNHIRRCGYHAEIATSEETEAAKESIERFKVAGKPGALDILVTVAMAYEGLDVPSITHIACLTHIRSRPWIIQMLARATRVDYPAGPAEHQAAFAYVPADAAMNEIIAWWRGEQLAFLRDKQERESTGGTQANERTNIIPLSGEMTRVRASELLGSDLDFDETARAQRALEEADLSWLHPVAFLKAVEAYQRDHELPAQNPVSGPVPVPPSEREKRLRAAIDRYCKNNDSTQGWEWGDTNRMVVNQFGKRRSDMSELELLKVWQWLQERYGSDNEAVA